MTLRAGALLGGYRIVRVLGSGGMGTVYLGKHPSLPRMDALKVLSAELSHDREFRGRFQREADVVAALDHPSIVAVHNRGEEDGHLWIAMQYVRGSDAAAELRRDPAAMTPLRALTITAQVGRGLDHAHRAGLLHRDIKPANFLLTQHDGEEERALLGDFGVAKSVTDTTELTQTGSFVATIDYAPPEQLAGLPLDPRSDIYSLGCSFYKLLTGQNPYPAAQPSLVMLGHLHQPPPRVTAVRPDLPPAIDAIFARVLAKNPAARYSTCREFTEAAAEVLLPGYHASHITSPNVPWYTAPPARTNESGTTATTFGGDPGGAHTAETAAHTVAGTTGPQAVGHNGSEPTEVVSTRPTRPGTEPPPRADTPRERPVKLLLGLGAAAIAAVTAAGIGVYAGGGAGESGPDTAATTASRTAPAQARSQNPAFQGKTITVIDFSQYPHEDNRYRVYLTGSPQARFLEELGFVYNPAYVPRDAEISPRTESPDALQAPADSYILALHGNEKANNGVAPATPSAIIGARGRVIDLEDPNAVVSMQQWGPRSEELLLARLVPVLRSRIE
ncbi:serine/threonine-protein kinase [Nocardia sp. NPDC057668]|uniref:serine/threonine-protein kinase n=1 Tax=Nocardia sp. NPDC057668 TaxID=3346202 RepID=UPI003672BF87